MKHQFTFRKIYLFICFYLVAGYAFSQTFELSGKDTINRTDENGMKQGKWMVFNKNNQYPDFAENQLVEELIYINNKREGMRKQYYPNGKIKNEITFKNNRPSGYSKFYYPNGNIAEEGPWQYGGWDGNYKSFYEYGQLSNDWNYAYGKREGPQKAYHENGNLKYEGSWKDGKENGLIKEYNEQGQLVAEKNYVEGVIDETTSKFHTPSPPTGTGGTVTASEGRSGEEVGAFTGSGYNKLLNSRGQVVREGIFSQGKLIDGTFNVYNADGILVQIMTYKDGKVIKTVDVK